MKEAEASPKWFVKNSKLMLVPWDTKEQTEISLISEVSHISLILLFYKEADSFDNVSAFHVIYTNVVKSHNTSCTIM